VPSVPSDILAPIITLGSAIESEWIRAGRDPLALPAIAVDALTAAALQRQVSLSSLVSWGFQCPREQFPIQGDPGAGFGEPPLTLWRGTQFRIDLLIWVDGSPDIHDHAFAGAFQVVEGGSLHGIYTFTPERVFSPILRVGALQRVGLERLGVGDVRPISPRAGLIHSLFHLQRPSATIVVRTNDTPDFAPQLVYLPPGLACASYPTQLQADPLYQRRLQLLVFYQRTGNMAFGDALWRMADQADPAQLSALLGYVFDTIAAGPGGVLDAAQQLSELLESTTARYPGLGARLLPVFEQAHRRRILLSARGRIHDTELRLLLALSIYAPDPPTLLSLVPSTDPRAWLQGALERLSVVDGALAASLRAAGMSGEGG